MLEIAHKYVLEHNIVFRKHPEHAKSKTKEIIFSKNLSKFIPDPLVLDVNPLPWIEHAKYMGNVITSIPDGWSKDARQKKS